MNLPLPTLGSFFKITENNFTLNAGPFVQIMQPDPNRWAFIVTQINNATSELDITADLTVGPIAILGTAGDLFERWFGRWTALVQLPWFAGTNVGPSNICVTEIFYHPPALSSLGMTEE